ncbi:hypothetical protein Dehly_1448 [Dehalogenimonas lykanthroporepellens BL-DC-9]|nr:hypothetical protein Dehly_1448 [Dehalogenimonas lykanthroporepellens BL-DC-9]
MKKLNKIFSIVLTAAIMTSLLITSAIPVAAADNAWSETKIPGATGMVLAPDMVASGPMAQDADGNLFVAYESDDADLVDDGEQYRLAKSTDGGRTWTSVAVAGAIDAIATAPDDASVVYIAVGNTVYKSTDGGATFVNMASVPDHVENGAYVITAMDVAMAGGSYKVVVGVKDDSGTPWDTAEVFYMDEGQFFNTFTTIGTPSFNTTHDEADVIYDIKLSPDFATDKGIVVLAENLTGSGNQAFVTFNVNGGVWGGQVKAAAIGASTAAEGGAIALPDDFNILTQPAFYVALNETTQGGIYRVVGGALATNTLQLSTSPATNLVSIDVVGNFAAANLIAGSADGNVYVSANAGANWTGTLGTSSQPTGPGSPVLVALAPDFATSGTAYALVTNSGGVYDESGFNRTVDKGVNWNQVSLVDTAITSINAMEVGNGFTWLSTQNSYGAVTGVTAGSFTVTGDSSITGAVAADTAVLTNTAGGTVNATLTLTAGSFTIDVADTGTGSSWVFDGTNYNIVLANAGATATITATADATTFNATISGATFTFAAGTDVDTDVAIVGTAPYAVTLPDAAVAGSPAVAGSFALNVTAGSVVVAGSSGDDATYTVGGPYTINLDTDFPTATVTNNGTVAATGSFTLTTATASVTSPFSLVAGVTASPADITNSIWRMSGGNWERVFFTDVDDSIDLLTLSQDGAALFKGTFGTPGSLLKSMDNGQTWAALMSYPTTGLFSFIALDAQTMLVGGTDAVYKTTNNGFIWENILPSTVTGINNVVALDMAGDAIVAGGDQVIVSTDAGATWTKAVPLPTGLGSADFVQLSEAFASTGIVYITGADGGLFRASADDFNNITPAFAAGDWEQLDAIQATAPIFAHKATVAVGEGVGLVTGIGGPQGMLYALDADGTITRIKCRDARDVDDLFGEVIAPKATTPEFTSASFMRIDAANGANTITVVGDGNEIWSYTDTLGVFGSGFTVDSTTLDSITISWDAVPGAKTYAVAIQAGETPVSNPFKSYDFTTTDPTYTFTELDADTTYFVRAWVVEPVSSFHLGGTTASTIPEAVTTPVSLAPVAGAIGVPVNPSFQWGGVPGATSYTVEVATDATFTNIVKTLTTPIAAVAWDGTSLANNTVYYWRVTATTATGTSAAVESVFTTVAAATPPVTVTTTTQPNITLTQQPAPEQETPGYIWIIIAIGGILTVLVIVLIVRTRRVV